MAKSYGVLREKRWYRKKRLSIDRSTFVIDPEGRVARALRRVKADGHPEQVLAALPD